MGDMADALNDQHAEVGEFDDRASCKYCGRDDLYWDQTDDGWRLFHYFSGTLHVCKQHRRFP